MVSNSLKVLWVVLGFTLTCSTVQASNALLDGSLLDMKKRAEREIKHDVQEFKALKKSVQKYLKDHMTPQQIREFIQGAAQVGINIDYDYQIIKGQIRENKIPPEMEVSMTNLAQCYFEGKGVRSNPFKAKDIMVHKLKKVYKNKLVERVNDRLEQVRLKANEVQWLQSTSDLFKSALKTNEDQWLQSTSDLFKSASKGFEKNPEDHDNAYDLGQAYLNGEGTPRHIDLGLRYMIHSGPNGQYEAARYVEKHNPVLSVSQGLIVQKLYFDAAEDPTLRNPALVRLVQFYKRQVGAENKGLEIAENLYDSFKTMSYSLNSPETFKYHEVHNPENAGLLLADRMEELDFVLINPRRGKKGFVQKDVTVALKASTFGEAFKVDPRPKDFNSYKILMDFGGFINEFAKDLVMGKLDIRDQKPGECWGDYIKSFPAHKRNYVYIYIYRLNEAERQITKVILAIDKIRRHILKSKPYSPALEGEMKNLDKIAQSAKESYNWLIALTKVLEE